MTWHHLQYIVGLSRLGHEVTFLEDYGWKESCYDPIQDVMTSDPSYGVAHLQRLFQRFGLEHWCYLAEDGSAYGMLREELGKRCRDADLHLNLSNVNWIPELEECRRKVLIDTDPVFTQIGAHGVTSFDRYDCLFTVGEIVHQANSTMPTAGVRWLPTRQPVVLDVWPVTRGNPGAAFTTVGNWSAFGDQVFEGKVYGMKDREFQPYFNLAATAGQPMQLAMSAPEDVIHKLTAGGWSVVDGRQVALDAWDFQRYLRSSRAEFSVAKHGFVVTLCGWFSERSASYLASGRPVLVQETGFSDWLETGTGVIPFSSPDDVLAGIADITARYETHCRRARAIAEEYFDARTILSSLIERAMNPQTVNAD
jgi:hypothetical protein